MFSHAYQGGPSVLILDSKDKKSHQSLIKVQSQNNLKHIFDHFTKSYILELENGINSKLQIPPNDKQELGLVQQFIVFQINVPYNYPFYIEFFITDTSKNKRRINLTSAVQNIDQNYFHVKIPNILIKRENWINLSLDLYSFMGNFKGFTFRSLDQIVMGGAFKLRRMFTMKHPLFQSQNDEFHPDFSNWQKILFSEMIPKNLQLSLNVDAANQVLSFDTIKLFCDHNLQESQKDISQFQSPKKVDGKNQLQSPISSLKKEKSPNKNKNQLEIKNFELQQQKIEKNQKINNQVLISKINIQQKNQNEEQKTSVSDQLKKNKTPQLKKIEVNQQKHQQIDQKQQINQPKKNIDNQMKINEQKINSQQKNLQPNQKLQKSVQKIQNPWGNNRIQSAKPDSQSKYNSHYTNITSQQYENSDFGSENQSQINFIQNISEKDNDNNVYEIIEEMLEFDQKSENNNNNFNVRTQTPEISNQFEQSNQDEFYQDTVQNFLDQSIKPVSPPFNFKRKSIESANNLKDNYFSVQEQHFEEIYDNLNQYKMEIKGNLILAEKNLENLIFDDSKNSSTKNDSKINQDIQNSYQNFPKIDIKQSPLKKNPKIMKQDINLKDSLVELVFDPVLNCYYDPSTNLYYDIV